MSNNDTRQRLLRKFKNYIDNNSTDPEFDEVELVELFDFAGDTEDISVQVSIMDYAYKRYPDYEPLLIRNALLQLDLGNREKADKLAVRVNDSIILKKIYNIISASEDGIDVDTAKKMLSDVLNIQEKFSDEDVIYFIETASEIPGGYEWIKDNMDLIRKHVTYLPTLLYELYNIAKDNNIDDAISYIEELTMVEPFEIDYWEVLTDLYISTNDYDKASNALEYAFAIDPSSVRARLLKAHIKLANNESADEVLKDIEDLIFTDDYETVPLYIAYTALIKAGRKDEAISCLKRYLDLYPTNGIAIDNLLLISNDSNDIEAYLESYFNHSSDKSEGAWTEWAKSHFKNSDFSGAAAILRTFRNHYRMTDSSLYLMSLYLSNRPGMVVEEMISAGRLWGSNETVGNITENQSTMSFITTVVVLVMSLIRTGNEPLALKLINNELRSKNNYMQFGDLAENMAVQGYITTLKAIKREVNKGTYPDEYDPLLYPNNLNSKKNS